MEEEAQYLSSQTMNLAKKKYDEKQKHYSFKSKIEETAKFKQYYFDILQR